MVHTRIGDSDITIENGEKSAWIVIMTRGHSIRLSANEGESLSVILEAFAKICHKRIARVHK